MSMKSAWTGDSPHIDESELRCQTGCGFYGNPAWDGHCSQCYKELVNKRHQRKPVFDPTNIKNKVSRSVSDVSEFQSKASSMMSRKFDKFEEKRKQQLDKKTKAVKSIFKKSQSAKGHDRPRLVPQLSSESQAIISDLQAFFKTINPEADQMISKLIKAFMDKIVRSLDNSSVDVLGELVHDFYNSLSDTVSTHPAFIDFTQEQAEKLNELTERYITTRLYKAFITAVNADSEEKDLAIQTRIRSLMWVSISHLECKVDESKQEVRATLDKIITELIEIDSKRVPMDKLRLLVSASNQVLNLLKQSSGGIPASADDFLPALIYCVLKANPPLLHSNLCYITNFAQQNCLMSGEAGYFFTNLCCAVSFIEKMTADSLGLTQPEFDRYMSGDALPPNALDGTYMCEGMRHMQENINHLVDMESSVNKLILSYDNIMADMEKLQENLTKEVDDVLERTPLTIRPKKANIDEPDPAQELLPPPLMPQSLQCEGTKSPSGDLRSVSPLDTEILTPSDLLDGPSSMIESLQAESLLSPASGGIKCQSHKVDESLPSRSGSIVSATESDLFGQDPFLSCDPFASLTAFDSLSLSSLSEEFASLQSSTGSLNYSNPLYYSSTFTSSSPRPPQTSRQNQFQNLSSTIPPLGHTLSQSLDYSRGGVGAPQPSYTGFSVQGGRIPSIPCDTGVGHSMRPAGTGSIPNPLSPSLEGPQSQLPPPLVPTASGQSEPKKEDKIDKMVNLLGDIVDTFDNLI